MLVLMTVSISRNLGIDRMLEKKSDAPTNAGKPVTSNIASVRNQQNANDSAF